MLNPQHGSNEIDHPDANTTFSQQHVGAGKTANHGVPESVLPATALEGTEAGTAGS